MAMRWHSRTTVAALCAVALLLSGCSYNRFTASEEAI